MSAAKKLFETEKITEKNQLEAVKRLNNAMIKLTDKGLDRDLQMLTELQAIKRTQNQTNEKLGHLEVKVENVEKRVGGVEGQLIQTNEKLDHLEVKVENVEKRVGSVEGQQIKTNEKLDTVEKRLDTGFQELATRFDVLNEEVKETREHTVDLLRMIVENTKKR